MKQLRTMTDAELQAEAITTRLASRSTAAERTRAVLLLDELAQRLARRIQTQTIGCSPSECKYPMTIGLVPGADVSIDGDVWPGSAFDRHLETCPSMPVKTRARVTPPPPQQSAVLHVRSTGASTLCGAKPSRITDTPRYADCADCLAIVNGTRS